jgi:molybdate transport system substrate-binding protein
MRAAAAAFAFGAALAFPACGAGAGGGAGSAPPELMVYAAASLEPPLVELRPAMEAAAGARVLLNVGASDALARQILAARAADLFLSADGLQVDRLEAAGLVAAGSRRAFLSNRLVVVVPASSPISSWEEVVREGGVRLAVADPEGVPAGRYAKAWLEAHGWWSHLAPGAVPAADARAALAAVESGAAQAGVVYRTDAALSRRVRVIHEVGPDDGPRILYVGAALAGRPGIDRAGRALECLEGPEARAAFAARGFVPVDR